MAEAPEHSAVDAVLPDVQEATVPMGAARRTPGQLQGRPRPGHHSEEAQSARGKMFQGKIENRLSLKKTFLTLNKLTKLNKELRKHVTNIPTKTYGWKHLK